MADRILVEQPWTGADDPARRARSLDEFAELIGRMIQVTGVDAVLCVTESGRTFERIVQSAPARRYLAATPSEETYERLQRLGHEVLALPASVVDRFSQAQHALSVALRAGKLAPGQFVAVAIGQGLPGYGGDFAVVMDVPSEAGDVALSDLVTFHSDVQPRVIDAALRVACHIGRAAVRGKRLGALIVLGDCRQVLKGSRQLVLNPLRGHRRQARSILAAHIHDMMVELAKLDGAFVVREDGVIETAGAFLSPGAAQVDVPQGLGTRHVAAAAISSRTRALAIAVAATDGHVRIFRQGRLVLRVDPQSGG